MNRKKKLLMSATSLLLAVIAVFCLNQESVIAQESCRIVRIGSDIPKDPLFIEPGIIRISKGDCVIWINGMDLDEVQIVFEDGKKCEDLTHSPSGFNMNTDSCYVTTYLPVGATSSLVFREKGTYEYVVKVKDGAQAKASIIVR